MWYSLRTGGYPNFGVLARMDGIMDWIITILSDETWGPIIWGVVVGYIDWWINWHKKINKYEMH